MCVILCKGLLDIHYVRLVDDIKGDGYWNVSRNVNFRLLDFIGLPWDGINFIHPSGLSAEWKFSVTLFEKSQFHSMIWDNICENFTFQWFESLMIQRLWWWRVLTSIDFFFFLIERNFLRIPWLFDK